MVKKLFLLIVLPVVLLSCASSFDNVGTIRQSVLKPEAFENTQKGIWVLLDGREIQQDSKLFKLLTDNAQIDILTVIDGKYYLPDALGRFIRCSNYKGKGDDPDSNRLVGSYQADEFKSHTHNYQSAHGNSVSGSGSYSDYAWDPMTYTTSPSGGTETRPKNISMYTYIKISK